MVSRKVYHKGGRKSKRSHGKKKMRKRSRRRHSTKYRHTRKREGGGLQSWWAGEGWTPSHAGPVRKALKISQQQATDAQKTYAEARKVAALGDSVSQLSRIADWWNPEGQTAQRRIAVRGAMTKEEEVKSAPINILKNLSSDDARKISFHILSLLGTQDDDDQQYNNCWQFCGNKLAVDVSQDYQYYVDKYKIGSVEDVQNAPNALKNAQESLRRRRNAKMLS